MEKYICLLSGGLDSVVNLYLAQQAGQVVLALTFDYGHRAASTEIRAARYFCEKLKIPHKSVELPWLRSLVKTALVNRNETLPHLQNLDDLNEAGKSAQKVWVPNRNGVFLNIAASFAESMEADFIVPGFNKEEAATFPDNSSEYIHATNVAFGFSTLSHVKVICFTEQFGKKEMVTKAKELEIDLRSVWSCYEGGDAPCGVCESCQRTLRALE